MSRCVDDHRIASRPFDAERDGFVMGEGAGFVVARPARRAPTGASVSASSLGHASTADAHHLVGAPA